MGTELSITQIALLEAIKASLFGIDPNYPTDTDWDEVVKEAKAQTVLGIISPVIPVKDVSVEMGKAAYMRLLFEQDKLIKLLDANDIPCVILKGFAAAQYYPRPHLRAMGDIDILVTRDKFEKSVEVLESNGYIYDHNKDEDGHMLAYERNIVYKKNGIIIELHHHFSSEGFDMDDILEQAIKKREYRELDGYIIPVLPDIENGLVLLGHINQHMRSCDLGLRQIIDWEMYIHKVMDKELWNNSFIPLVKSIGLEELSLNTMQMCRKYCGLSDDFDLSLQIKDNTANYINIIFETGNFGRKARVSTEKITDRRIMSTMYNIKKEGFFRYFNSIGLNNWMLCKKYPFLKSFAWVYGISRTCKKAINAKVKIRNANKNMKKGSERIDLNNRIGVRMKKDQS